MNKFEIAVLVLVQNDVDREKNKKFKTSKPAGLYLLQQVKLRLAHAAV